MLSKILTASALGGQFWIKDSPGIAGCVLELDGAVCIAWCLLSPPFACISPYLLAGFEGHSVASGVLRELFETIQTRAVCQATFFNFFARPFSL